jgi:hypothetical protein
MYAKRFDLLDIIGWAIVAFGLGFALETTMFYQLLAVCK